MWFGTGISRQSQSPASDSDDRRVNATGQEQAPDIFRVAGQHAVASLGDSARSSTPARIRSAIAPDSGHHSAARDDWRLMSLCDAQGREDLLVAPVDGDEGSGIKNEGHRRRLLPLCSGRAATPRDRAPPA